MIDQNALVVDSKKRPHHFYFEDIPTPFVPLYEDKKFIYKYSSETLTKSHRDHFLNELHGKPNPELMKMITILSILLGLCIFVIMVLVGVMVYNSQKTPVIPK